jgi:hypothetical protein
VALLRMVYLCRRDPAGVLGLGFGLFGHGVSGACLLQLLLVRRIVLQTLLRGGLGAVELLRGRRHPLSL